VAHEAVVETQEEASVAVPAGPTLRSLVDIRIKLAAGLVQSVQSGELRSAISKVKVNKQPVKPKCSQSQVARAPREARGLRPWAPVKAGGSEAGSICYYKDQLEAIKKHGIKNVARFIAPPGTYEEVVKTPKKPKDPKPADEAANTNAPLAASAPLPPLKVSAGMKQKQAGVRRTPRPAAGVVPPAPFEARQNGKDDVTGYLNQIKLMRQTRVTYDNFVAALHCKQKDSLAQTH